MSLRNDLVRHDHTLRLWMVARDVRNGDLTESKN